MKWYSENNVRGFIAGFMTAEELLRLGASATQVSRLDDVNKAEKPTSMGALAGRAAIIADDLRWLVERLAEHK